MHWEKYHAFPPFLPYLSCPKQTTGPLYHYLGPQRYLVDKFTKECKGYVLCVSYHCLVHVSVDEGLWVPSRFTHHSVLEVWALQ